MEVAGGVAVEDSRVSVMGPRAGEEPSARSMPAGMSKCSGGLELRRLHVCMVLAGKGRGCRKEDKASDMLVLGTKDC